MKLFKTQLILIILSCAGFLVKAQKQPNLLIIHTDEHNFRTLSCYQNLMTEDQAFVWGKGNNVQTPNIDRLAKEGTICMNYYAASPVCTPSRASMITGLYPQATGAPKNGEHLREDVVTFAEVLKENGYSTSYVGKWHLAGEDKYQFNIKYKAGFDDNRYMMHGGHAKYLKIVGGKTEGINEKVYNNLSAEEKKNAFNVTDYFTDKALEILERDKNKPFCLMVSIPDPHTPDYARPPYNTMYNNMDVQPPKTMDPKYTAIKPLWALAQDEDKNEAGEFKPDGLRQYFGMVKQIDDNVGRLLDFLDKNKLTENTIVVFTSDHGDMYFEHNRMNKGVPYEASARIPFVLRYPAKVIPGKVIRKAYTNVDFTPTILGIMGVKNSVAFDGMNTASDFLSRDKEVVGDRITYFAKSGGWWVAAVNNRYKLVLDKKEKPYLFDLENDPDELINFYNKEDYKEIGEKLMKELFAQMKKYKEPGLLSNENKPYITE